jgi:hypothetical protein
MTNLIHFWANFVPFALNFETDYATQIRLKLRELFPKFIRKKVSDITLYCNAQEGKLPQGEVIPSALLLEWQENPLADPTWVNHQMRFLGDLSRIDNFMAIEILFEQMMTLFAELRTPNASPWLLMRVILIIHMTTTVLKTFQATPRPSAGKYSASSEYHDEISNDQVEGARELKMIGVHIAQIFTFWKEIESTPDKHFDNQIIDALDVCYQLFIESFTKFLFSPKCHIDTAQILQEILHELDLASPEDLIRHLLTRVWRLYSDAVLIDLDLEARNVK